jgi:hypothetical protein
MGRETFSKTVYRSSLASLAPEGTRATRRGEQTVRETGKLDPLVDPSEFGVVRESRIRLEERKAGGFEVTVGAPVPIEYRLDTTGSMGDNVERALKALPQICGLASAALPERDPFYCASIFGDVVDRFVLCRGQFEAEASKMVNQLTLMHPEANGGDSEEDPHYGFFGAAYLSRLWLQRAGLRSYDFTITDAPMHDRLSVKQLERIFGASVLEKARENGHQMTGRDLPTNKEMVRDLLKRAHAFALLVTERGESGLGSYWQGFFGAQHVVVLPQIEHVPHVMAAIIGLTEGTFDLQSVTGFLTTSNLSKAEARRVVESVAHIPLGAQRSLRNFNRLPTKGAVYAKKDDIWPAEAGEVPSAPETPAESSDDDPGWL